MLANMLVLLHGCYLDRKAHGLAPLQCQSKGGAIIPFVESPPLLDYSFFLLPRILFLLFQHPLF